MGLLTFFAFPSLFEQKLRDYMNRTEQTDTDLALALQEGDERAFDEIVRRYQGRVYAVAYKMTHNREDALDVSQESLVKAYRKIGAWRSVGCGFLPWLLRLTTNQAIDLLRRKAIRRHEPLDEAFIPETAGAAVEPTTEDTAQQVRAHEIDERVRAALVRLSPAQRTVFVMRHFEGLQLSEIAAALGCTDGSVKVHLFRALKKLQKELVDLHEN
jgi:RNA polymerase sigma-70 factor (ECF subfamily)